MTTVGDPEKFAAQYELDRNSGSEWMFGRFCYWCAGHQVGDYEVKASLRDVLFQLERSTNWVADRRSSRFCSLAPDDVFRLLDAGLFGTEEKWQREAEQEMWARHDIAPPVDVFDEWKVFAVDCDLLTRVIFAQDPYVDVRMVEVEAGRVTQVLKRICEELSTLHDAAGAGSRSE